MLIERFIFFLVAGLFVFNPRVPGWWHTDPFTWHTTYLLWLLLTGLCAWLHLHRSPPGFDTGEEETFDADRKG